MGVRLNKVLTELNIGLQTAVDYLKNKKSLGEIKDDANMNTKINDEQYEALVKEFRGDKDVKTQAGMMFPKKKEKEKVKKETKPEPVVIEVKEEPRQTFTPLGKIDLNQVGKPAPKEKAEPKPEPKPVDEKKAEQPAPQPKAEPKPEPKPKPKPEPVPTPEQETKAESEPESVESVSQEPEVYKLKTEQKAVPNLNVVGKIDLDSLNQSTRPKKRKSVRRSARRNRPSYMVMVRRRSANVSMVVKNAWISRLQPTRTKVRTKAIKRIRTKVATRTSRMVVSRVARAKRRAVP